MLSSVDNVTNTETLDDVGQQEQTTGSARLVKVFANTHKYWQGLLQLGKRSQAGFGNWTANQTKR